MYIEVLSPKKPFSLMQRIIRYIVNGTPIVSRMSNMIKTIIFDLDGVLIESKEIHLKEIEVNVITCTCNLFK